MPTQSELLVTNLGPCRYDSPLAPKRSGEFVSDDTRIVCNVEVHGDASPDPLTYEKAGPREKIFFDPARTRAAFVTCGGLSPGLNNVLRSAVYELHHRYGVTDVLGIRDGYRGLNAEVGQEPMVLDHEAVTHIHNMGGTILGSSRGPQEPTVVVDFLEDRGIDILFCIGGEGTQRGAHVIAEEVLKRGLEKAVVGIPKTIDNDIPHVWPSFGYATALETAAAVIHGAHVEAVGAPNGVSLVKLMGRSAGFIAAGAAIVSQDANFVLVPEIPFPLEGDDGFLATLERRVLQRGHAVVIVAEGAGQHLFEAEPEKRDASGNLIHHDIGVFLRDRIRSHFQARGLELNLRYMDPSYLVRSLPANAWDRILCDRMARNAVHAGMAGKTDVMVATRMSANFYVPIPAVVKEHVQMDVNGDFWDAVLATTVQPRW
ncbi:MAG: ATP-dependent 6-phosphofructokinase [Myxococcota bacterium]|nr:ATP-dependent 6-phosphofructokinase [Myxococcota bacterium]